MTFVEAFRTPNDHRHRTLLNFSTLDIPKDEWKTLADRIEEILTEQQSLFVAPACIESPWSLMPAVGLFAMQASYQKTIYIAYGMWHSRNR